jgi:hypothetical protein
VSHPGRLASSATLLWETHILQLLWLYGLKKLYPLPESYPCSIVFHPLFDWSVPWGDVNSTVTSLQEIKHFVSVTWCLYVLGWGGTYAEYSHCWTALSMNVCILSMDKDAWLPVSSSTRCCDHRQRKRIIMWTQTSVTYKTLYY